jgi:hypothetical protein
MRPSRSKCNKNLYGEKPLHFMGKNPNRDGFDTIGPQITFASCLRIRQPASAFVGCGKTT